MGWDGIVVETMPCLPPMTGNGKHNTYKNDNNDSGMVYGIVLPTFAKIAADIALGDWLKWMEMALGWSWMSPHVGFP